MIDTDIRLKEHKYAIRKTENNVKVFTETKDCSAYYAQVIDNIKIKPSPAWLKARLMAAGVRPISNVVDITNYVLMEYGQPLHAFDLDKVKSETIIVRHAKEGETLVTLDDQKRDLLKSDLVITDGEKTIALAGVMGGLETEIDDSSNRILLEAACFDPVHIRKTSKRLDLKSEASTRFEKGVDPNKVKKAMDFATQLFIELADGEVVGEYTFFDNNDKDPLDIELTLAKLNHVTGKVFSIDEVKDILRRLRFKYHLKDDKFTITVPTRRQSFYSYQDVIEEIVRIYGYDKIPVAIPKTPTSGYLSVTQKLRRLVRNYFVNIGFNETVTYSLVSAGQAVEFDKTQIPVVEVMNPLNKEKSCLRHSLLPSLIDILQYNKARKINDVMLFELGRKYESGKETELLSGLMNGIYAANLWQGKKEAVDFYQLKGIIETLLNRLNIEDYQIIKTENPLEPMHPGICADVLISGEYIGFFGKLHPQREYDLGISKTFLFEFDFEKIAQAYKLDLIMDSIPKYPSVTRDLALLVDKSVSAAVILEKIREANKKSLVDVEIFDIYSGENIEEGKLSIALSLTFQNPDKTLEAKDVDTSIERILKHLEKSLGAKLR